jgi:predicted amidohydrolase YtcJ
MFSGIFHDCFDSHLHWQATGEFPNRLQLSSLKSPEDLEKLRPLEQHYRGPWLIGFGWDHSAWNEKPHRKFIDSIFPDIPVCFIRVDGHSNWVNSKALKLAGIANEQNELNCAQPKGGEIILDADGKPTGWLIDTAKNIVDRVIPAKSRSQIKSDLLTAQTAFLEQGITHIRDMSCDPEQWEVVKELNESGELKIFVDQFFDAEDPADFPKAFELALQAQKDFPKLKNSKVKMGGVKFYSDGSLGSDSAWISGQYPNGGHGLVLLEDQQIQSMLSQCWSNKLPVAVHTIGDAAVDFVVTNALKVKEKGLLHLEHVEMARPESIEKMTRLNVRCHLQPSHFLSDRAWLKDKLKDHYRYVFPWAELQRNQIPFYFGSDSPIEALGLGRTLEAVSESSQNGVAKFMGDWRLFHQYGNRLNPPDRKTWTRIDDGKITEMVIAGEKLV